MTMHLLLSNQFTLIKDTFLQLRFGLIVLLCVFAAYLPSNALALVHYDQGRLTINGVQLLQSVSDPNRYEYLPGDLSLARSTNGELELLMTKYVGSVMGESGGILHALVQFTIDPDRLVEIERKLVELHPGAVISGPVSVVPAKDDANGNSFQVVSAILNSGDVVGDRIHGKLVYSGIAPFSPGSKAALAARLSPDSATLMWDSLTGATADLSVAVRGHYEAQIEGYNAIVRADMETIYAHDSFIDSFQKEFTKRQVRDVTDKLIQSQAISVDVFDRSAGTGIDSKDMEKITDVVTDKLIELVFDRKSGWSKVPEPEPGVEQGQICNRQPRGFFSKLFSGATDDAYCSDDQYVIKNIEDINRRSFVLNLAKKSTILVPFDTAGNLGGFYSELDEAERNKYFKIVSLDDVAFEDFDIIFQLDSAIVDAFNDKLTLVSVNLKQNRSDGTTHSKSLIFNSADVVSGGIMQQVKLLRLGDETDEWRNISYQTAWNLSGLDKPLRVPADAHEYITTRDGGIQLTPPLSRETIAIDVDTTDFKTKGIHSLVVQIASKIHGKPQFVAQKIFRATDSTPSAELAILKDPAEIVVARRIWHTNAGRVEEDFVLLTDNYLSVSSPSAEWFSEHGRVN